MIISLSKICNHPENQSIYGKDEDISELKISIKKNGINIPITIVEKSFYTEKANVIISGHRRVKACRELGITEIPCVYLKFDNKYEELERLLLENEYREKTKFQKLNEAEKWEEIEKEKAKERQLATLKQNKNKNTVPENFPERQTKNKIINNYPKKTDNSKNQNDINENSKTETPNNNSKHTDKDINKDRDIIKNQTVNDTLTDSNNTETKEEVKKETEYNNHRKTFENETRYKVSKKVGFGSDRDYDKAKKVKPVIEKLESEGKKEEASILKNVLEKSTDAAYKIVKEDEEIQREVINQIKSCPEKNIKNSTKLLKKVKKEAKQNIIIQNGKENYNKKEDKDDIQLQVGDFRELSKSIEDNSIDLILTDPPYPKEYLPLWGDMFKVAERILKPSGFLIAYSGNLYLDKIFKFEHNLLFYWILSLSFTKIPIISGRNVQNYWKPILIFQKKPFLKSEVFKDNLLFEYDKDREMHDNNWGQTLKPFEYLLNHFSKGNDLVYEPFCGTGTTVVACHLNNRRCIAHDIESKNIDITKGRLC